MRFKEFISESFSSDGISIEEAVDIVKERGLEWKKFTGGFPTNSTNWLIYRGMHVMFAPDFVVKSPRSNRKPLTTIKKTHDQADDFFKEEFGIAFRSNSIFTARSKEVAGWYGDVYAIFPLDRVSFAWSEEVEDFTAQVDDYKRKNKFGSNTLTDDQSKEMLKSFDYHFNDSSLQEKYFKFRDFNKHELMIHCDEYLAVREEKLNEFLDLLL